ncbi:hypothetical protein BKA69DRAFT_453578 [Paraphysoderma sedebokerense]|nr:hypothetical protein BKA69DRAFT_453578 [Paraphysoderma sedebokerense]
MLPSKQQQSSNHSSFTQAVRNMELSRPHRLDAVRRIPVPETQAIAPATIEENSRLAPLFQLLNKQSSRDIYERSIQLLRSSDLNPPATDLQLETFRSEVAKNIIEVERLIELVKLGHDRDSQTDGLLPFASSTHSSSAAEKKEKKKRLMNNQHLFDITALSISEEKKIISGRKPIRLIAAELQERLETLRNNANQWDMFNSQVMAYKAAQKSNRRLNALQQNMDAIDLYTPDKKIKHLKQMKEENSEHRKYVRENRKLIDERKLEYLMRSIQKTEDQPDSARDKPATNSRFAAHYQKWLVLCAIASRFWFMQTTIEQLHEDYFSRQRQERAAKLIQRVWRKHHAILLEKRRRWALKIISRLFFRFVRKRREQKKHWAANVIRGFFKEIHDVSKLMKIIKKYRFSVVTAQRHARQFLEVRQCQLLLLMLQWDSLESTWWAQHRKPLSSNKDSKEGAMSDEETKYGKSRRQSKSKIKKEESNPKEMKKDDRVVLRIPDEIRIPILLNVLLQHRMAYRKLRFQYDKDREAYNVQFRGKLDISSNRLPINDRNNQNSASPSKDRDANQTNVSKPPTFKVLLPNIDMMELISRGFMEFSAQK